MKKRFYIAVLSFALLLGCNSAQYITVKHIKPVNYNRSYNRKKDKRKKRVKYVKMKILKQSATVKPVRTKKKKEETENSEVPINESDSTSTGFLP